MQQLNRPSWTEVYFEFAKIISKRSKDPHTKVGAVLVKEGCVIGVGYNGEPRNYLKKFNLAQIFPFWLIKLKISVDLKL